MQDPPFAPPPLTTAPPTAQGSFAKTPFPHLLVYALERGLSGTFELVVNGASAATLLVYQGFPAKLRITEGVHYLGDVMLELGLITPEALQTSRDQMQESPRLQGQILKELGAVDDAGLDAGVRGQLDRKIEHLFGLPPETTFAYYDGVDALTGFGGPPTPIDPLPALWRGVRQAPAWEHVDATLRRVGVAAVRLAPHARVDRFKFTRLELGAVELIRPRPMRIVDLAAAKVIGPSVAQLLVYLLVITKQVDLVEVSSRPPPPPPPSAPVVTSSATAVPASSPGMPPASASGRAFARVQLQAKPVVRAPLIVQEAPAARNVADARTASPLPQTLTQAEWTGSPPPNDLSPDIPGAPPTPVIAGVEPIESPPLQVSALDIGSMITTTIQSSVPPPAEGPGSAPPASVGDVLLGTGAPSSAGPPPAPAAPPARKMAPEVEAEQRVIKEKILERANTISAQDYFQMLGLDRAANAEAVHKAFIALAKVWHPDRLPPGLADVKNECSKIFTHLTEAQATLTDPERREEYMTLLKDGGATPDDQAIIHAILQAATEFQKAEIFLKRSDIAQATELAKKAYALDPEQPDYLAMVTWLESQEQQWTGKEKTLEKVKVLDSCIKRNPNSERAYFWRGMLYKRIDEVSKAVKDFRKAAELNPRNLDAVREVRLYQMRGGSKPPPAGSRPGGQSQRPPQPEKLGGLFGKLFKK